MAQVYNYRENVCEDIRNYIEDHNIVIYTDTRDEQYEELYDYLFCEDSVTGNASGSYTFNTYQAEENLCHNFDLLAEALNEFGYTAGNYMLDKGAEWCDVTIRCYLLSECLSEVLDELAIDKTYISRNKEYFEDDEERIFLPDMFTYSEDIDDEDFYDDEIYYLTGEGQKVLDWWLVCRRMNEYERQNSFNVDNRTSGELWADLTNLDNGLAVLA